jgi:hypothetical protein
MAADLPVRQMGQAVKFPIFQMVERVFDPATETFGSGISAAQGGLLLLLFLPTKKSK